MTTVMVTYDGDRINQWFYNVVTITRLDDGALRVAYVDGGIARCKTIAPGFWVDYEVSQKMSEI